MGKTSLVLHALGALPRHAYPTAYVDLWPSDGAVSFVTITTKAIAESNCLASGLRNSSHDLTVYTCNQYDGPPSSTPRLAHCKRLYDRSGCLGQNILPLIRSFLLSCMAPVGDHVISRKLQPTLSPVRP